MSDWFVTINGAEKGPYTAAQIRDAVSRGKINADTLLRKQGTERPQRADQIKGLIPQAGTQSTRRQARPASADAGTARNARNKQKAGSARQAKGAPSSKKTAAKPASGKIDYGENTTQATPEKPAAFDAFAKDEAYVKHIDSFNVSENYPLEAAKAFIYPLSMNAIALIISYVILGMIFVYGGIFLINAWSGFHFIFYFLVMWFIFYFIAYLQRIGQRSAEGDLKAPVWPEIGAMLEEIFGPAAVMIGAWVLLRIPYIAVAWGNPEYMPHAHGLTGILNGIDDYFFHAFNLMFRLPSEGIEYIAQGLSFLILPIGILFVMVKGGFLGLNPGPIFKTVFSIMPEYLLCLLICTLSQVAMMLILGEIASAYEMKESICFSYMVFDFLPSLKVLDVLIFLASSFLCLGYFMILQFRVIGLLYCTKSESFSS